MTLSASGQAAVQSLLLALYPRRRNTPQPRLDASPVGARFIAPRIYPMDRMDPVDRMDRMDGLDERG
jgi:hypothetical protein